MAKWERPEGWPEGLDPPAMYQVGPAAPGGELVPLADGRLTVPELAIRVDPRDGNTLDLLVRVVDGRPELVRVTIENPDRLAYSSLRRYPLREYVERGLAYYTIPAPAEGSEVELTVAPLSSSSLSTANKAIRRRRNTRGLLERVAELYREGGGAGGDGIRTIAEELNYDPRHARRLRARCVELGLLEEGE
jgi:hypothetical protein